MGWTMIGTELKKIISLHKESSELLFIKPLITVLTVEG